MLCEAQHLALLQLERVEKTLQDPRLSMSSSISCVLNVGFCMMDTGTRIEAYVAPVHSKRVQTLT